MKRIGLMGTVLAAMVFGTVALGFDAFFSNAAGQKVGIVAEGEQIYIAVNDPNKGYCGIDQFQADLIVFDWKTGAYIYALGAWFRELGGIGSGLYFWVTDQNSNAKVAVQVGSRLDFGVIPEGQTHVLGRVTPFVADDSSLDVFGNPGWAEGAWEYIDEDIAVGDVTFSAFPQNKLTARTNLEGLTFTQVSLGWQDTMYDSVWGRLENMDTLVLLVRDLVDRRNIDQDQVKIKDTVAQMVVEPAVVRYGCGPACQNLKITIKDADENLNCNEVEYVPVFVIINPGSWNGDVTNFCNLMLRGGYTDMNELYDELIRWYNIYENERYIDYIDAPWVNPDWGGFLLRAVFFAAENGVSSGEFVLDLGNLEDLQEALWGDPEARDYRLPAGTTIAFYYIDPNDFDDMTLGTVHVITKDWASEVFITDYLGNTVNEVRLGSALYVRVYDGGADVEACCQDKVVVHICDPHNEDDSEYVVIDEISNHAGIFFTQNGLRLLPVWDALNGYQLVFDDWNIQAFNEDTIFVRYNSVEYTQDSLNALGDGDPNDGFFPPEINYDAGRNRYEDVAFAMVKVYDYQVFDGATHHMRFLDGNYQPVTQIPISGSLYLEVTDLDQDENPLIREVIRGSWNRDAAAGDVDHECSAPLWCDEEDGGLFNLPDPRLPRDGLPFLAPLSITGKPQSVKIFMANLQRGTWEVLDLRETQPGSGVFRSTTCVLVSATSLPGLPEPPGLQDPMGHLNSARGDTIIAFYQDPSNHSDISIISIKVTMGGAGEITPPVAALAVAFDRTTYYPGDTFTITVTDEQFAGAAEIVGTNVLVVLDKDGEVINGCSWNRLEAVAGQPGKFRVSGVLPATVKIGKITAKYTNPVMPTRVATAEAEVKPKALTRVTDVVANPNPFSTTTTFTIVGEPAGAAADRITITIFDLTGAKVRELTGTNTTGVAWDGKDLNGKALRNGAYIYVAVVQGAGQTFGPFKGFVYIVR